MLVIEFPMLIIVLIIVIIFFKTRYTKYAGMMGESRVSDQLIQLDKEKYKILNDILIPKENGGTAQIDHVVVSKYGIFVLETKNYDGWIFGDQNNQYWTQIIHRKKSKFYNPIWQNLGHVKSIQHLLGVSYKKVKMIPMVVFTKRAELKKINAKDHVLRIPDLISTIVQYTEIQLTVTEVDFVFQTILNADIKGKDARKEHVKRIKQRK